PRRGIPPGLRPPEPDEPVHPLEVDAEGPASARQVQVVASEKMRPSRAGGATRPGGFVATAFRVRGFNLRGTVALLPVPQGNPVAGSVSGGLRSQRQFDLACLDLRRGGGIEARRNAKSLAHASGYRVLHPSYAARIVRPAQIG